MASLAAPPNEALCFWESLQIGTEGWAGPAPGTPCPLPNLDQHWSNSDRRTWLVSCSRSPLDLRWFSIDQIFKGRCLTFLIRCCVYGRACTWALARSNLNQPDLSANFNFLQASPLCSWLDRKGWSGGAKVQLKINIVEVLLLRDIICLRHILFPGSVVLEHFFWLQQGCHLWGLEGRHQCFDRVCKKNSVTDRSIGRTQGLPGSD